ncbi:MAG: hypothetical protein WCA28_18555 [Bradyrhizobium sp.]
MSTFIICRTTYILPIWPFSPLGNADSRAQLGEDRYEAVARYCRHRPDLTVAARLRGIVAPRLDRSATRLGPVRRPGIGCRRRLFYRVYLSRNLVIVASGAIFLVSRQWTALAILMTITATLPLFDMSVLSLNGVTPPAFHPAALAMLAITAALLWLRASTARI